MTGKERAELLAKAFALATTDKWSEALDLIEAADAGLAARMAEAEAADAQAEALDSMKAAIKAMKANPPDADAEGAFVAALRRGAKGAKAADVLPDPRTDWTGEPKAREWIADGWLPTQRVALLTGAGGGGKSLMALQLAAGIASGDPNPLRAGVPAKLAAQGETSQAPRLSGDSGGVLFLTWEDEHGETLRRLDRAGVDRDGLGDRLAVLDMAGRGPLWAPKDGSHRDTTAKATKAGEAVAALIRARSPRLVVIDPTAGAYAASENDRAAVRSWLSHLGALAHETGAAVLLIAHPSKSAEGADFSGSTDWRGGVRALWTLRPETVPGYVGAPDRKGDPKAPAQGRALTLAKANYARDGRRAWMRLVVKDGDGAAPGVMRWEECTALQSAKAYHEWRGWPKPRTPPRGAAGASEPTPDPTAGGLMR